VSAQRTLVNVIGIVVLQFAKGLKCEPSLTIAASWSAIIAFPYFSTRLVINLLRSGEIISENFGWRSTTGMLFVRHLTTRSVVTP
jgi:hypothetical protein